MGTLGEDPTRGVEEDCQIDQIDPEEQEEDQEKELCQEEVPSEGEDHQGKQGRGVKSFARFVTTRGHRQEYLRATPGQGVAGCH